MMKADLRIDTGMDGRKKKARENRWERNTDNHKHPTAHTVCELGGNIKEETAQKRPQVM